MELKGIHHVSAITANALDNYHFYTKVLGMRLVKKTVNQDDTSMYHLFYADEIGRPGTDLTFFEINRAGTTYRGNNSISLTSLRVQDDEALQYWVDRFDSHSVKHNGIEEQFGRKVIYFEDKERQRLALISDETNEGVESGIPWKQSVVPQKYGITGLGPVRITVPNLLVTEHILVDVLKFRQMGSYLVDNHHEVFVFSTGKGGTGAEIHAEIDIDAEKERPGKGSVHHLALRVTDRTELEQWREIISAERLPNSGIVDRYYFQSLYFRERNGILIELATDGPGFATDESIEHLGESLALPPFLENQREDIERNLVPLYTKDQD